MTKIKYLIAILAVALFLGFVLTNSPKVRSYFYGDGGEPESEIYVIKKVSRPRENDSGNYQFEYDLGEGDSERYQKMQIVAFEIHVKNTGDHTINKIVVTDHYPEYVDFPSSDSNWDRAKREYRYEITNLESGKEDVRVIEGRIITDATVCINNWVEAVPDNGDSDSDEARFCLGKRVLGVTSMPSTGTDPIIAIACLVTAAAGAILAKRK